MPASKHGKYRVGLRREVDIHRFIAARFDTEDDARGFADRIAALLCHDVDIDVLAGVGRSTRLLYAVAGSEGADA